MRVVWLSAVVVTACGSKSEPTPGATANGGLPPDQVCMLSSSFRREAGAQRGRVASELDQYVRATGPEVPIAHRALANQLQAIHSTRTLMYLTLRLLVARDPRLAPVAPLLAGLDGEGFTLPPPGEKREGLAAAIEAAHAREAAAENAIAAACEGAIAPSTK